MVIPAMVKAEKARNVEDMLISAATSGKLGGKVTEDQFIQMLEQVKLPVLRTCAPICCTPRSLVVTRYG